MTARVVHLFRATKRREPMESLPTARVIADAGFEGCAHARPGGKRQVLLVDAETLQEMDLAPGIIRENITTEGLRVNALKIGQKVRIGKVELQVSAVCEPCEELEKVRAGLPVEIVGKRGMLCKVLRGGMIQPGETIQVEAAAKSS
jgi:MOSC domain-containing protein YiiM